MWEQYHHNMISNGKAASTERSRCAILHALESAFPLPRLPRRVSNCSVFSIAQLRFVRSPSLHDQRRCASTRAASTSPLPGEDIGPLHLGLLLCCASMSHLHKPPDFCRPLLEEHGEDAHEGEWQSVQRRGGVQGAAGRAIKFRTHAVLQAAPSSCRPRAGAPARARFWRA
jgi:hypothetical protein